MVYLCAVSYTPTTYCYYRIPKTICSVCSTMYQTGVINGVYELIIPNLRLFILGIKGRKEVIMFSISETKQ